MDTGKVVTGAILLLIAIWIFLAMSDFTARFVGGGILGILGLGLLIQRLKSSKIRNFQKRDFMRHSGLRA